MSELTCPDCGGTMRLRASKFREGRSWYGCERWPQCDAAIGAHPDGRPLGFVADKATRAARMEAHIVFDRLWRSGQMTRKGAYRWMQEQMGLSEDAAHIAMFDAAQCAKLIDRVASVTRSAGRTP